MEGFVEDRAHITCVRTIFLEMARQPFVLNLLLNEFFKLLEILGAIVILSCQLKNVVELLVIRILIFVQVSALGHTTVPLSSFLGLSKLHHLEMEFLKLLNEILVLYILLI